jgi:hypothetical protein
MRSLLIVLIIALTFCVRLLSGQAVDWNAALRNHLGNVGTTELTTAQQHAIVRALVRRDPKACEVDNSDWKKHLVATAIDLGKPNTMLIEASVGCGRGTVNGAMWLIQWHGATPVVLGDLSGWFYGVLPHQSHGLHDCAAAWHMSAREFSLAINRFDGSQYRTIAAADVTCDEGDNCTAKPKPLRQPVGLQ